MDSQESTNRMVNPPNQTQMISKQPRMVKVFSLRPFKLDDVVRDSNGVVLEDRSRMVQPGEVVEVSESIAKSLIKKMEGSYAFAGERHNADGDITKHNLTIARLATKRDLVQDDVIDPLDEPA